MGSTAAYNRGKYLVTKYDYTLIDVRVLLVSSAYVFSAAHNVIIDVNAAELAGTGYVRKQLTNKQIIEDDASNLARFLADNITWAGSNFGTPDAAIVFVENGSDTASELLFSLDLQPKVATTGVDWTLQWPTGIALLQ